MDGSACIWLKRVARLLMIVWVRGIDGPGEDEFEGGGDVVKRGTVAPFVLWKKCIFHPSSIEEV